MTQADSQDGAGTTNGTSNRVDRRQFLQGTAGATGIGLLAGCTGSVSLGQSGKIKLGASAALTGKYSQEGKTMKEGYEAWVNQINEHGGILTDGDKPGLLGREVELITYDDQSDPARAVNLYKRLLNQDNVDLLLGPYSSAVSTSVIPIIEQNKMACVMPMMSDTSVLKKRDVKYITQSIAPASTYVKGSIKIAANKGAKTMAVVHEDTAFPTAAARGHIPYAKNLGIEIVHKAAYPKDVNDYTPVMNEVKSKNADIVMGGGYTPDAIGLTKAARSLNFSPGIFAWLVGSQVPAFYESVGKDARAITGDLFWAPWFKVPLNKQFVKGFLNTHNNYKSADEIDYHSPGGYAGCLVMEKAVRNVGELNQKKIAQELHNIEMGIPFANGKYKVNKQGVQVGQAPSTGQWQQDDENKNDGEPLAREAIWPKKYGTAPPVYPHPGWN